MKNLEQRIGYTFKNRKLLHEMLCHSSYANEKHIKSNERLEFFGDAVLSFIITEMLYNKTDFAEGSLTKMRSSLISAASLSKAIDDLKIIDCLKLGHSMNKQTISNAIKCDFYEVLVAGIYLDGGLKEAERFVVGTLKIKDTEPANDYKTTLQELLQKQKTIKIQYMLKAKTGKAHCPQFEVELFINGVISASGKGRTKGDAEQNAAKNYLERKI